MGKMDWIQVVRGPRLGHAVGRHQDVVVQAEFVLKLHVLKPGLIFKGKGLKPVAFKLWVNGVQLAPPHQVERGLAEA
jgi:hypothetical protein